MKIVNATKSLKTYFRGDGSAILVKAGSVSEPEVATDNLIDNIIKSGTVTEVGIVLSNDYELRIAGEHPGATPFIYSSEKEAVDRLINGKDFTPVSSSPDVVLRLKTDLQKKEAEIDDLKAKLSDEQLRSKQAEDSLQPFKDKIESMNKELESITNTAENEKKSRQSIADQLSKVNEDNKVLVEQKAAAEKAISDKDEQISKLNNDINELKSAGEKTVAKLEEYRDILNDIVSFYNMEQDSNGKWRIPAEAGDEDPEPSAESVGESK